MAFGKNIEEAGMTSFEKAVHRLQEGTQEILIGQDTQEKNGRFFLFNMEVSKKEYDQFLDVYNLALDIRNKSHVMNREEQVESDDYKIAA